MRTDYDTKTVQDMVKRTAMLFRFAAKLKWLSDTYKVAVVVVNQVTSTGFENNTSFSDLSSYTFQSENNAVVPALGLVWTHCVNTRIMLHRNVSEVLSTPLQTEILNLNNINNTSFNRGNTTSISTRNNNINHITTTSQYQNENDAPMTIKNTTTTIKHGIRSRRKLQVVFSPTQPPRSCNYIITAEGVFGVS